MKKVCSLIFAGILLVGLCACSNNADRENEFYDNSFYNEFPTGEEIFTVEVERNPQAELTLTDGSEIVIELCYDIAPNAVANFIAFADEKIYNHMGFTEVRNNCIVMTGAIEADYVSPYYTMDEVQSDDIDLSHVRGTVSMIRTADSDTLTGQFFILTKDQTHFDSHFTAFGKVIEGMENIDKIASAEKDEDGKIIEPVGVKKVKVNTFGADIPLPTIILK